MSFNDSSDLLSAQLENLRDDIVVLRVIGEVDLSSAHVLTNEFKSLARDTNSNVIIDATGVSFMDSTGLHALVEGKRAMHENGCKIFLVPSPQVRRVVELVFPDHLFADRVDSVADALAVIDGKSVGI